MSFSLAASYRGKPEFFGSSAYGSSIAAVCDPSEPSMNPLSIPVCSIRSDCGCESRFSVQLFDRIVERQPLADPRRELAFLFQFFVDLEVFPRRANSPGGGHTVLGQIGERKFQRLAALRS